MSLSKALNVNIPFLTHVSSKDKALLARQLATMLSSGLDVAQAFKILASQTTKRLLKTTYIAVIMDLEQGNSLSFALARHKLVFDPVFVAIVRSGESSGKLDKVLDQLALRLEQSEDFNAKIKSALYYPVFVVATMFLIVILMMIYVIPQLKEVFADNDFSLPWTTQLILSISTFTVNYWWLEIIVLLILVMALMIFLRTKEGGSVWDNLKIKIPLINDMYELLYMSRFCRTMSMMLSSGIPIMEAIAITADVIQNRVYTRSLQAVAMQVERGIPMSVPLQKDKNFPQIVSQMVMVGEQTGKMSITLSKLAEYYEKETENKVKGLSALIEPVLIVLMGIGVGFLAFSIIWPIYSFAQKGF